MKTKIYDPKRDIINTLSYKNIFGQPMTLYQIIYFCHTKFQVITEIQNHLKDLIERHKINYKNGYYFLGRNSLSDDFSKDSNTKLLQAKATYTKLENYKYIFEKMPFIKFVGVTGTLASYSFDLENDDIDLFFICQKNRLWISRLFVVLLLKILNIYVNNQNPSLKVCPNLYISENEMSWKESKRSLYIAHEIAMLQPLVDKENTYLKFLRENLWIKEFLPNLEIYSHIELTGEKKDFSFLDFIEYLIMKVQKLLMGVRYGSEILNKNMIHFIKEDHSVSVLDNYERIKS